MKASGSSLLMTVLSPVVLTSFLVLHRALVWGYQGTDNEPEVADNLGLMSKSDEAILPGEYI